MCNHCLLIRIHFNAHSNCCYTVKPCCTFTSHVNTVYCYTIVALSGISLKFKLATILWGGLSFFSWFYRYFCHIFCRMPILHSSPVTPQVEPISLLRTWHKNWWNSTRDKVHGSFGCLACYFFWWRLQTAIAVHLLITLSWSKTPDSVACCCSNSIRQFRDVQASAASFDAL